MVDIFVGAGRKQFHLHHDLLCDRSDYFKACFEGGFKEAEQKELFLPEDDIESFGLFVKWLYGASLKKISSKDELSVYFTLFVLANKLCLEHLRNETMDQILRFDRTSTYPVPVDYQIIRFIYRNTSDQDSIRKYLVDLAAWTAVFEWVDGLSTHEQGLIREGGDLAVDFAISLSVFHAEWDNDDPNLNDPRRQSNCTYLKHNSTPFCAGTSVHRRQLVPSPDSADEVNI